MEGTLDASTPSKPSGSGPQAHISHAGPSFYSQPSFSCPCPGRAQLAAGSPWPLLRVID